MRPLELLEQKLADRAVMAGPAGRDLRLWSDSGLPGSIPFSRGATRYAVAKRFACRSTTCATHVQATDPAATGATCCTERTTTPPTSHHRAGRSTFGPSRCDRGAGSVVETIRTTAVCPSAILRTFAKRTAASCGSTDANHATTGVLGGASPHCRDSSDRLFVFYLSGTGWIGKPDDVQRSVGQCLSDAGPGGRG